MTRWDKPGVAECIDALWDRPNEVRLREEIAAWIGSRRGKLLDVGCGSARLAALLRSYDYIGIDNSKEMLALAPEGVSTRVAPADRLPGSLKQTGVPTAVCTHLFRHLPDYRPALSELAQVVKGRLFIVDIFGDGPDVFGEVEVCGQTFHNNIWSLAGVMDRIGEFFPSWKVSKRTFDTPLIVGLRVEAPKG